ncbi:MAG: DUF5115 domain-containing protein [Prevotella sp.]|nr:DUF5115 domain-containing protein [Prevotella sp.]
MIKKIFFGLTFVAALTACTDDYKDWAQIPTTPQPETVAFGDGSVTEMGVIDLNAVTDENVQVCSIKAPTASDAAYTPSYTITIGDETYNIDANGTMSAAELQAIIADNFGRRPVQREVEATVSMWLSNGTTAVKTATSAPFKLRVIPQAPEVEQAYYVTGSINGWDNTNTSYKLTNDGRDPYENPTFTCRIPAPEDGSNVEFKMTPESGLGGDWSKCLAAGSDAGKFVYDNGGGNLVVEGVPGAKFYDLVFNMLDQTWTATALFVDIEAAYYFTGSINGWNNNDTSYKLTNDGRDPYENPTFTCRIPAPEDGSNVEFKMTPESGLGGDWSKCLAAGTAAGTFVYNNGGGNLVIEAVPGAKYYDLTFNMMELTWSYKAVAFEQFVYFIGATDGWSKAEQKLALADESGIYTGYLYCADPNGWGNEFKFQKIPGNWDSQLNSGTFTGGITGDFADGGDNIKAAAGEGVYYVTLDLANNTLNAVKVNKMGIIGDFNGWGGDVEMTWNATDYCFEATNPGVNANGWKFRVNSDWGINLGGDTLDNLVANGANLSAVGNNIKLYPTRKTSDNIYCTVE